jgi:site-specific recombinase XerC
VKGKESLFKYTLTIAVSVHRRWDSYMHECGTHSPRRSKASLIYKATGNLRAIQILLGHSNIENTVRYLGVDVDDAITLAECTEI